MRPVPSFASISCTLLGGTTHHIRCRRRQRGPRRHIQRHHRQLPPCQVFTAGNEPGQTVEYDQWATKRFKQRPPLAKHKAKSVLQDFLLFHGRNTLSRRQIDTQFSAPHICGGMVGKHSKASPSSLLKPDPGGGAPAHQQTQEGSNGGRNS